MTTKQPVWKYLANLGDVNPIDHGGFFVYVDTTKVYGVECELLEPSADDDEDGPLTAYRFIADRCTYVDGILSDNPYHPESAAWFADLEGIAACVGQTVDALRAALCSAEPLSRAMAYRELVAYYGPNEFDSEPITLTRKEAKKRYKSKNRTRYVRDYYTVAIPGDAADDINTLAEYAITDAREMARLYVMPAEWIATRVSGTVGDHEVIFRVRRKRAR